MNRTFTIVMIFAIIFIVFAGALVNRALAGVGVPKIISYQGRLLDSNGNLLGGSGAAYCFRFSLYNVSSGGTQVWPAAAPSIMTATVTNGVFNIGIGDTSAGGDALTYDFQSNDTTYLNVQVATKVDPLCTGGSEVFETLSPRERVVAAGYAINAGTVDGYSASTNASGTMIPVIASDTLTLAGVNPQIDAIATNTLTLQGGTGTGAIQFFSANNFLNSSGAFTVASTVTGNMLQATATSSQLLFQGVGASGTLSWTPTVKGTLTIPNFAAATDTIALVNFAQALNNKTLNSPTINTSTENSPTLVSATAILGMSILQNAAGTGLTLQQNATGTALAIVNAPTSTQALSTVSITNGANVSGAALLVANFGSGNALQVNDASSTVFTINGNGNLSFNPSNDTTTAFTIKNASQTIALLTADTFDNEIKIGRNGAPGSIPTILGLDEKADAGDPTGFPGAMYYNSSTGEFRCDQGGVWQNCITTNITGQPLFAAARWGYWAPTGESATVLTPVNTTAVTAQGTAAASAQAEDYYVQWTSAATNGSIGGEITSAFTQTQPRYLPRFATRIRTDTAITSRRIWVGLNSAALTGTDGTGALATVYYGLRYSTNAGDTTWQCASGDGTTGSVLNTGVTVTTSTYYDIILDASTPGQLTCMVATNGGNYVSTVKSTNIPSGTTALGMTDTVTTLTTTADIHRIAYIYLETR